MLPLVHALFLLYTFVLSLNRDVWTRGKVTRAHPAVTKAR